MRNHLRVVQDLFLASISPLCYFTITWTHRERREKFLSGMPTPRGCGTDLDELRSFPIRICTFSYIAPSRRRVIIRIIPLRSNGLTSFREIRLSVCLALFNMENRTIIYHLMR